MKQVQLTGSKRDSEEQKGSPNLIPLSYLKDLGLYAEAYILNRRDENVKDVLKKVRNNIYSLTDIKSEDFATADLENGIKNTFASFLLYLSMKDENFNINRFEPFSEYYRQIGVHFYIGAQKYDEHNWRKGQFLSRIFNSLCRHFWAVCEEKQDEDHATAVLWNILAMYVTIKDVQNGRIPREMLDFPYREKDIFAK